jgi:hypothetical protein
MANVADISNVFKRIVSQIRFLVLSAPFHAVDLAGSPGRLGMTAICALLPFRQISQINWMEMQSAQRRRLLRVET